VFARLRSGDPVIPAVLNEEGKKIGWKMVFRAIWCLVKFSLKEPRAKARLLFANKVTPQHPLRMRVAAYPGKLPLAGRYLSIPNLNAKAHGSQKYGRAG